MSISPSRPLLAYLPDGGPTPPVSVVILTFNEERNIAPCIASCAWCDDIHVLDSGSTDRTCEIAASMGAAVHHHPFKSFGDQRNWAIDNIPCKHQWHFHLDADERFTAPLVREMLRELGLDGTSSAKAAYLVPNQLIFMNTWVRHSVGYPVVQMRLFHVRRCRFTDFGHGQREQTAGEVDRLTSPYLHYGFSKGIEEWLRKHNSYSSREAEEGAAVRRDGKLQWRDLRSRDPIVRRRAAKKLAYFLKGRSWWRFVHLYLLNFGWLDSTAGFHYCSMISMYEYWIELKMHELERDWSSATDALAAKLLGSAPAPAADPSQVEVLILTSNDAVQISAAVASAAAVGPVFVLDSHSTDGTQDVARAASAAVIQHDSPTPAAQSNWAVENLPLRAPWLLVIDADDRIPAALVDEIRAAARHGAADAYLIRRQLLFMGKLLPNDACLHSDGARLIRRASARCAGRTAVLSHKLLRVQRQSLRQIIDQQVSRARHDVQPICADQASGSFRQRCGRWFARHIWPRLPAKPLLRFLQMYLFRRGFQAGPAGWHAARLAACQQYMIDLIARDPQ